MTREERLNEKGTLPPCPMCGVPRVQRSDYVRCNPCGVNWLDGEAMDRNPKVERWEKMIASTRPAPSTQSTGSSLTEKAIGASSAVSSMSERDEPEGV